MSYTLQRVQTLETLECGNCGTLFAVPEGFLDERRKTGATFYCPNGHGRVFRETNEDRLRKQLEHANRTAEIYKASATAARDQREAAERSNVALRGHITRHRKRAAAGVCPVPGCKRHFADVQAHIDRKHPAYVEAAS